MRKYVITFKKGYKRYTIICMRKKWIFWINQKHLVVTGNNQDAAYLEAWRECLDLAKYYNVDEKEIIIN